ncbi:MAG TPA: hypothetical protein VLZ78_02665 [Terrimesophilobacter sp.]|nr:hypothetical protein [Terrimesophilobacter sp.]
MRRLLAAIRDFVRAGYRLVQRGPGRGLAGAVALALLTGCASSWRPATGTGPASFRLLELRRFRAGTARVEVRRIVIVDNPTGEDVILDCVSARFRIGPHLATDVLLMPGDKGCDLHNDVEYGAVPDVQTINGELRQGAKQ